MMKLEEAFHIVLEMAELHANPKSKEEAAIQEEAFARVRGFVNFADSLSSLEEEKGVPE